MPLSPYSNICLIGLDDDAEELEMLSFVCDELNIKNRLFTTKKDEFLARAKVAAINMCLIDHTLGDTTGLDVMKEVKKINQQNYVLVFSGIGGMTSRDFDILEEYVNNGADKFLRKNDPHYELKLKTYLREGFEEAQRRIKDWEEKQVIAKILMEGSKETDELLKLLK